MNDEQLRANTIGDRKPLNDTIRLVPYDLAWPTQFARYANEIVEALGDKVVRIEHVGSTSIPGISAKPIIDLVIVVEDSSDEPALHPRRFGAPRHVRVPRHRATKATPRSIAPQLPRRRRATVAPTR